jgi:hypothetical protein
VDAFARTLPQRKRKIVERLRSIILKTLPVKEEWKWGAPFSAPLCYIGVQRDRVNLGFCFGSLIPNAKKYMEGTGNYMMHQNQKRERH